MDKIDYSVLPEHMRDAAQEYVEHGGDPGWHEFLYELLTNDLYGVFQYGDSINIANLQVWMTWVYNDIPHACWGTPAKVKAWCEKGGLLGVQP